MVELLREEFAWAAGFFDGEGTTLLNGGYPRMSVGQVDREALDHLSTALGMGRVVGPHAPPPNKPNWSYHFYWHLVGFERVQAALAFMWPWLGTVKRRQAAAVLGASVTLKRPRGLCNSGHTINTVGRIDGRCAACYLERHPNSQAVPDTTQKARWK